jgi:hypothetical protein
MLRLPIRIKAAATLVLAALSFLTCANWPTPVHAQLNLRPGCDSDSLEARRLGCDPRLPPGTRVANGLCPPCEHQNPGQLLTPPPPASALGVSLNCEHEFEDPGLAKCTAQPINPSPGASISYDWTFDGAAQGASGTYLELNGVKPGPHTVMVVAHDTNNNLTSELETVSFTKGQPVVAGGGPNSGGGPKLGGWGSTPPSGGTDLGSSGPVALGGGSRFNPAAILLGILGITAVGAAVAVSQRRRKGAAPGPGDGLSAGRPPSGPEALSRPKPAAPPEAVSRPVSPTSQATPSRPPNPPTSGPESITPTQSDQSQQNPDQLWLTADPIFVIVHGDNKDVAQVRIAASKTVNGVTVDASNEVRTDIQAAVDDKHVQMAQIDNLNYSFKGILVGTEPHDLILTVSGVSLSTGRPAAPIQITVRVTPVKVELKIGVIKKGFLYQELIATIPDICRRVSGRVVGLDPTSNFSLDSLSAGVGGDIATSIITDRPQTPTYGNQPVAHAHCWVSSRADGVAWGPQHQLTTDENGQFRFGLLRRFAEQLGAQNVEYQLPVPIELSVNSDVSQSLNTYGLELQTFKQRTSAAATDPTWGSPLATAQDECADYPRRFYEQLCKNPEDDYNRLLGAINLLRGVIIFAYKYRDGFKDERSILNQCGKEVFGGIIDVILAAPISTSVVKWMSGERLEFALRGRSFRFPSPVDFILGAARKLVKIPGGKVLLKVAILPIKIVRFNLLLLMKQLRFLLNEAVLLAGYAKLSPRFVKALANDLGGGAVAEGEVAIAALERSFSEETERVAADAFGQVARAVLNFVSLLEAFVYGVAHIVFLLIAFGIRVAAATISAVVLNWDYEGAQEFWGEVLDNQIGQWMSDVYDSAGGWLEARRKSGTAEVAGKSLCDTILDKVWNLQDMDRTIGDCLTDAYGKSVRLELSESWRDQISKVCVIEDRMMAAWSQDYTSGDNNAWGWIQIGEEVSRWIKLFAKIFQIVILAEAVLIEGLLMIAEKTGLPLFVGPLETESPIKATSRMDLLVDSSDLFFRAAIFAVEATKLRAIINKLPWRVARLYAEPGAPVSSP